MAIISTTSTGGLAARDGTSVAAAHVAALAALVLAHHPDFRNGHRVRGAARVDRVHQIIRASCHPVGDPRRTGAGLPDAVAAVGLAPNPRSTPVPQAHHPLWSAWTPTGLTATPAAPPVEPPGATALQAFTTTGAPLAPLRTAMRSAGLAVAETDDQTD